MSVKIEADICVVGAGSGGLSVAAGAVQLGRKTVLIEKGEMGGDCLNYGCVPSKALLAAASAAHSIRTATKFGANPTSTEFEFSAVNDHVRSVIAAIAPHDSQKRFEDMGVKVIREHGEFTGRRTIKSGKWEINAKHFVIATGSSPFIPQIPGLAEVPFLTNETIFSIREKPSHLIVIGGGPIGVEMAQAHQRLGAKATIIETASLLGRENPDAVDVLRQALIAEGVSIFEKRKVVSVSGEKNCVSLTLDDGTTVDGSHLLVAAGRRPNLDGLGLIHAGVAFENGRLKLDKQLRTTNKRIYIAGDAAGGAQFTHVAGDHASTIIRNILFKMPAARRDHLAPRVTYSDPEIASVGVIDADPGVTVTQWSFVNNDRAQAERRTDGFMSAYVEKNGRIAGATIVGARAGDEIGIWAFAIANKLSIKAMTNYIAPYPTRGEISKRTAGAYFAPTLFSGKTKALIKALSIFD